MKLERSDLLKRLLSVSPGLSSGKDPVQGDCIVIRRGRLYTFNDELACSIVSGLDPEMDGAINASAFIGLMKRLTDKEIDLTIVGKQLVINATDEIELNMEAKVFLPVDTVDKPKAWVNLPEYWTEAVDLVHRCTNKKKLTASGKPVDFGNKCVHVHPEWLEASDNNKMARWTLETFVSKPCLVRGTTLKEIVPLGMTKGCETQGWLHFHNPLGLRVSVRKWALEHYPDLTEFYMIRGEPIVFPKGVAQAADRANQLLDEKDGSVKINLMRDQLIVSGEGIRGRYKGPRPADYKGRPMCFRIPSKLIGDLVENTTECEVTEVSLRVAGEGYVYLTSLEVQP